MTVSGPMPGLRIAGHGRRLATVLLMTFAGLAFAGVAAAFWLVSVTAGPQASAKATALSAPTNATATVNGSGAVTVGWTLPGSQLTGATYQVTRTSPGTPAVICTVSSTTTSCQDTGLTVATAYGYSVKAVLWNWVSPAITASATTATPTLTLTLASGPYTAGTPTSVQTVTAKLGAATDTTYAGTKTLDWFGLSNSPAPSNTAPVYPSSSATFVNGIASPASAFTTYMAGSNVLSATDHAAAGVTGSVSFSVNPGSASKLAFSTQPTLNQNIQAAGTGSFAASVSVQDSNSNVVLSDSRSLTLSLGTNPSGGVMSCTNSGGLTVSAVSGVASFSGCGITKAGAGYILTASASPVLPTPANANAFNITSGAADATQSTLTPASASIVANGTATQVLTVQAKDANGNGLTVGGSTVTITKSSGTGTIGSVTDNGNGMYTATVTAPTATGSGVFVATLGSTPVKSGTGSQTQATVTYLPAPANVAFTSAGIHTLTVPAHVTSVSFSIVGAGGGGAGAAGGSGGSITGTLNLPDSASPRNLTVIVGGGGAAAGTAGTGGTACATGGAGGSHGAGGGGGGATCIYVVSSTPIAVVGGGGGAGDNGGGNGGGGNTGSIGGTGAQGGGGGSTSPLVGGSGGTQIGGGANGSAAASAVGAAGGAGGAGSGSGNGGGGGGGGYASGGGGGGAKNATGAGGGGGGSGYSAGDGTYTVTGVTTSTGVGAQGGGGAAGANGNAGYASFTGSGITGS